VSDVWNAAGPERALRGVCDDGAALGGEHAVDGVEEVVELEGFARQAAALTSWAQRAASWAAVMTMMGTSRPRSSSWRANSQPSSTGMRMSSRTSEGGCWSTARSASAPLVAVDMA
jgi:hypothetical protein